MTTASTSTKTEMTTASTETEKIVKSLKSPCQFVKIEKFGRMTFTSPKLAPFKGQRVFVDEGINYNPYKANQKPKQDEKYLVITMECREPGDNSIAQLCDNQTPASLKCKQDRVGPKIDEEFQDRLFHAKRLKTNEDTVVTNNSIEILLRIICSNLHQGLGYFVFYVEIVDQDGVAKFRGVFTAFVANSKSGVIESECSVALVAV